MEDVNEHNTEYQGCFLIGLTKGDGPRATPLTTTDRQSAETALLSILNTFAEQIRGDENYFDSSSSWVDVDLVAPSGVRNLHVDSSAWGNAALEEEILDDDEIDLDVDGNENEDEDQREAHNLPTRSRLRTSAPSGVRLRPASDILSRLRWDANINIDDYIIGYDDRFLGDRETSAGQWKAELTDEAFIPMHRILYFRRKSDGVRIWDRETKTDLLFNSGASSQGSA